jgi:hypothetical protein
MQHRSVSGLRNLVISGFCAALAMTPALARGDSSSEASKPGGDADKVDPAIAGLATTGVTIQSADGKTLACNQQLAQPFLVRGNWFKGDPKTQQKAVQDAIKYRTEKYGYFQGFGSPNWNAHPPRHYARSTTFLGMAVQVHEKVVPALKCVEAALKAAGADVQYKPRSIGGIRFSNTYRGSEVSNHVYGIAIDIEPDRNTCCGCLAPWNEHPLCKKKVNSIFERMAMPKSWVDVFERYGFYWLGHDQLQDTMHFEFLGDPDAVTSPRP